jgi:hypothetical protein
LVTAACSKEEAPAPAAGQAPSAAAPAAPALPPAGGMPASGPVIETMNSGGYTYALVDAGPVGKVWCASPETPVSVGKKIYLVNPTPMPNFKSSTLNRTFDLVYFCQGFADSPELAAASSLPPPASMPPPGMMPPGMGGDMGAGDTVTHTVVAAQGVSGVKKASGGHTVSDIYQKKDSLAGKDVTVRGKVVKFTPNIMRTNWVHIQDGTGKEGENDLTVTTDDVVASGDTVVVTGKLAKDKDFTMGYFYPVIVESAKVVRE